MNKAIFIDKDGTLINDIPYNVDPHLIRLENYALESLWQFQRQGYSLVVVSNQSGIEAGYFYEDDLINVQNKIAELLSEKEVQLNGFYYCPHLEKSKCNCRKPKPGLLLKAAEDLQIDLSRSWMIGDILNDVEAGRTAGCKTILLDCGNETEWIWNKQRQPDYIANTWLDAAQVIRFYNE